MNKASNEKLRNWVNEITAMCQPDSVYWCDGSDEEFNRLAELLVRNGTFTKLNMTNPEEWDLIFKANLKRVDNQ